MAGIIKKTLKILLRILCVFLLIFIILLPVSLPWTAMVLYHTFSPNPPKPVITHGEFRFELVYDIDGEIITVKDTYVNLMDLEQMRVSGNIESGKGT